MSIKFDKKFIFPAVLAGVVLLLSVLTFLLCQPLLKVIDETGKQEASYSEETTLARGLLASKNVKGLFSQLTPQGRISSVMEAMKKLAAKQNVSLALVRPPFAPSGNDEVFGRVLFDMKATASLKDLGNFLTAVRNKPESIIDVQSLDLSPNEGSADQVTAKITFVLFVARNNEQK